jgi:hypothetical protein
VTQPTRATASVGKSCIRRFARTFDGVIEGIEAVRYKCRALATERITTSVTFRISAKADCDDIGTLVQSGTSRQGDDHSAPGRFCAFHGTRTDHPRGSGLGHRPFQRQAGPDRSHWLAPSTRRTLRARGARRRLVTGRGKGRYAKMTLSAILSGGDSWQRAPTHSPTLARTASSERLSLRRRWSVAQSERQVDL